MVNVVMIVFVVVGGGLLGLVIVLVGGLYFVV